MTQDKLDFISRMTLRKTSIVHKISKNTDIITINCITVRQKQVHNRYLHCCQYQHGRQWSIERSHECPSIDINILSSFSRSRSTTSIWGNIERRSPVMRKLSLFTYHNISSIVISSNATCCMAGFSYCQRPETVFGL
jgi:hypothetical protein